jgi:tetratricopeptide (TPR) repeat protein
MKRFNTFYSRMSLAVVMAVACSAAVAAQDSQERPTLNKDKQQPQSQQPAANTLSLETPSAPPASAEEDTALKTITSMPEGSATNLQAKIDATEGFLQKYPQTRYRSIVYTFLTMGYVQVGKADKGMEYGDKELELNPNDVATMAIVSQTIPRVINPSSPDAAKKLEKAETLGKKAVEIIPTLPKPEGMTDEVFTSSKNQTLAMAHGGLGLVDWRRGKYADAIPELEESVKLDTVADPVNWLILGVVNQNTSHFDAASAAYNHCASITSSLQNTCKTKAEEAKKLAATKLSAPK